MQVQMQQQMQQQMQVQMQVQQQMQVQNQEQGQQRVLRLTTGTEERLPPRRGRPVGGDPGLGLRSFGMTALWMGGVREGSTAFFAAFHDGGVEAVAEAGGKVVDLM